MQRFLLYYWICLAGIALLVLVCLSIRDPSNKTAAPLSTIQILFLYVVITPPAGALSVQPASKTVMLEPPRPPTESIFNKEIIMDTFAYGVSMAVVCVVSFFVPLYVLGNGVEGIACDTTDSKYTSACYSFFRARGSLLVVASLTCLIVMVHCRSYRNIEWNWEGIKKTVSSKILFITLIADVVFLCIFMYIPVVALEGFHHSAITWEWGLDIALVLFYIAFGELYKWMKRRFMKPLIRQPTGDYANLFAFILPTLVFAELAYITPVDDSKSYLTAEGIGERITVGSEEYKWDINQSPGGLEIRTTHLQGYVSVNSDDQVVITDKPGNVFRFEDCNGDVCYIGVQDNSLFWDVVDEGSGTKFINVLQKEASSFQQFYITHLPSE
ncbi:hypothetical protein BJ944DRAFT_252911 [Cunninghamella echinulata]|nr:hypothetical protein BJ944DRAFT_252911 [Cunninghamella echinulata]